MNARFSKRLRKLFWGFGDCFAFPSPELLAFKTLINQQYSTRISERHSLVNSMVFLFRLRAKSVLLVSTRIHRGGPRQQHQRELQIHSSPPRINLEPCRYSLPHFKCVSTVMLIITPLLTVFPTTSQAQLTLANKSNVPVRVCVHDIEAKKQAHSKQAGQKQRPSAPAPAALGHLPLPVTKAQRVKAQVNRPRPR